MRAAASAATRSGAAGVAGGNCTDLGIRKSERTLPWRCTTEVLLKRSRDLAPHRPIRDAISQCADILALSPRNTPCKGKTRHTATARRATDTQNGGRRDHLAGLGKTEPRAARVRCMSGRLPTTDRTWRKVRPQRQIGAQMVLSWRERPEWWRPQESANHTPPTCSVSGWRLRRETRAPFKTNNRTSDKKVLQRDAGRHPARRACSSEQNQRSPRAVSILTAA